MGREKSRPISHMKYKIREQFYMAHESGVHEPGTVVDLTDAEAARVAHMIEPAEPVVEAPRRGRPPKTTEADSDDN